jgi:hypothetical protein
MLTSLRAILRSTARALGVERAANIALIEEMWPDVVGWAAAAHSRVTGVRGTVLLADAEAGPWTQDLSAQRGRYLEEINRRLGSRVLTEIRFRQTATPFPAASPARTARGSGGDGPEGNAGAGEEPTLSPEEIAAVDRVVAEIADPEVREGARRAMISQRRWQRRHA